MTNSNFILGVNRGHNGAVCLIRDGALDTAIEVERLERIRYANGNYVQHAIDYCLRNAGISEQDLDLIVTNSAYCSYPQDKKNIFVSHHLAHAYGAYALSDFEDAAIIIADGSGNKFADVLEKEKIGITAQQDDEEAESYYYGHDGKVEPVKKRFCSWDKTPGMLSYEVKSSHRFPSLGHTYSLVSDYIFGNWVHAGKTMALAAFGKNVHSGHIVTKGMNGELNIDQAFMNSFKTPWNIQYDFQECANLASYVQKEYEEALIHQANWLYQTTKSKNLCISGGCGLNIVANARVLEETPFENVFVMFAPGDNGVAIGAAYYGLNTFFGGKRKGLVTPYLGREYSNSEILNVIANRRDISFEIFPDICKVTAELIAAGRVIGWFQGKSEFGPRALGNRSILADPRRAYMVDYLNKQVKHREWFRPYSPAVLSDRAVEFFDLPADSPYMSFVGGVRTDKKNDIPAAVHKDGTARIQTVNQTLNPRFYKLIKEFEKLTSIPLVLNTSFNDKGDPISETPADALRCFLGTKIDYLIMGDCVIKKNV